MTQNPSLILMIPVLPPKSHGKNSYILALDNHHRSPEMNPRGTSNHLEKPSFRFLDLQTFLITYCKNTRAEHCISYSCCDSPEVCAPDEVKADLDMIGQCVQIMQNSRR